MRQLINVRFFNRAWESSSVYRLVGFVAAWVTLLSVECFRRERKWQVKDTKGNPLEIPDGTAKGNRADEGLNGTWKAVGDAVLITWDSEWTTKITKKGNAFEKTALRNGKPVGQPTLAMKVQ